MIYDLEHSDINLIEVSKDSAIMYGGVGKTERSLIKKLSNDYNIKVVFTAVPYKKYLSDVEVNILNEQGQKLVKVISKGPYLYAKIPPGIFTIQAAYQGKIKKYHHVEVTKRGKKTLYFSWNIEKIID